MYTKKTNSNGSSLVSSPQARPDVGHSALRGAIHSEELTPKPAVRVVSKKPTHTPDGKPVCQKAPST